MIKRNKLGQFVKGFVPWNKGIKLPQFCGKNNPRWTGGSVSKKCIICGKEFLINRARKNITNFCSMKCLGKSRKGKHISPKTEFKKGNKHPIGFNKTIKDGNLIKHHDRWYIYKPNHPYSNKGSYYYIARSRFVAEKCLGRYLTKKEVIHHIDGNTLNDNPENLYLFASNSKHTKFHYNSYSLKSNFIFN